MSWNQSIVRYFSSSAHGSEHPTKAFLHTATNLKNGRMQVKFSLHEWRGSAVHTTVVLHIRHKLLEVVWFPRLLWKYCRTEYIGLEGDHKIVRRYINNSKHKICLSEAYLKPPHIPDNFLWLWKWPIIIRWQWVINADCCVVFRNL